MKKPSRYVLPALLVISGLGLLVSMAVAQRIAVRTQNWTQAIGRIETVTLLNGAVDVTYRYDAAGPSRAASRGTLTVRNSPSEVALHTRYAPGRSVLIYVNPADPTDSVLEHPARPSHLPLYGAAILIASGIALARFPGRAHSRAKVSAAKPVRPASAPMSRLRPPPSVKRT